MHLCVFVFLYSYYTILFVVCQEVFSYFFLTPLFTSFPYCNCIISKIFKNCNIGKMHRLMGKNLCKLLIKKCLTKSADCGIMEISGGLQNEVAATRPSNALVKILVRPSNAFDNLSNKINKGHFCPLSYLFFGGLCFVSLTV